MLDTIWQGNDVFFKPPLKKTLRKKTETEKTEKIKMPKYFLNIFLKMIKESDWQKK